MKTAKTLFVMLLIAAGSAQAVIISVVPASTAGTVNDVLTVDVMVDDLNGSFVGTFDVTTTFDASVLALDSVAFDVFLDSPFSIQTVTAGAGAGSVSVSEVSLDLLLNQDGFSPFRLFSLSFLAIATGTSELALDALLGDFFGSPLAAEIRNGRVNVEGQSPAPVPEPSSLALLFVGLICGLGRKILRRGVFTPDGLLGQPIR